MLLSAIITTFKRAARIGQMPEPPALKARTTVQQISRERIQFMQDRVQILDLMIVEFSRTRHFYGAHPQEISIAVTNLRAERVALEIEAEVLQKILAQNKSVLLP